MSGTLDTPTAADQATARPSWFEAGPAGSPSSSTTAASVSDASPDTAHLIGRTSGALIAVVAVILLCAWLLRRLGPSRSHRAATLPVVASRSLGQRERVVVIQVEDEWLVLGVTSQQITPLHRLPAPADAESGPAGAHANLSDGGSVFGRTLAEHIARFTGRPSA